MSVIVGILIGLVVALVRLGAAKKGRRTVLSTIADVYVDVIRGTPSVLQLMIIYFAVFHSRLGYVAAVVSFGINSGAYVSEVIRGGILSVDKGQSEAGRSLGLGYKDTMRFIVIPQAVKTILPAMGNEFIQLIKETSILGLCGNYGSDQGGKLCFLTYLSDVYSSDRSRYYVLSDREVFKYSSEKI